MNENINGLDIKTVEGVTLFYFKDFSTETLENWVETSLQFLQKASAQKSKEIRLVWDFSLIGDSFQLSSEFKKFSLTLLSISPEIGGKIAIVIPDLEASAIFVRRMLEIFARSNYSTRFVKIFVDRQFAVDWITE